ncbi:flagellar filament capping protein FliD [Marinobacter maritimus]|uniref:flagellar filament capping protein FliD n=1 Tax=Marinobacter maritimus TaxID=277961 RepID=UPI00119E7EB3|nr:flagellar filament capping protein FliD [Marinobacter maritimus]|tara:strand:+ start:813 stop:2807 length:1995 start_codon:yes stop_codon:yes gene_type:complete
MAGISSLGIGSGVLTSDLVDQLVAAERAPTDNRLTLRTQQSEAMLSAYGKLRSAITELRLPMSQLSFADNLKAFSATSSNEDIGVTVDSTKANRGSYSLDVTSLASAQALASKDVFADRDTVSVGEGKLTLSVGDRTKEITIDSSNNSLQGLANAINDSGVGVSAGIIDTGSGFQLVLSADETGTANAVSITANDNDGNNIDGAGLSRFAFNTDMEAGAGFSETIAATNAVMEINGIEVTRSSNSFENVIDGLSFSITDIGTSTVKVSQDVGAVTDRVQGFVDKFNALQSTIDSLAGFNSDAGVGSLLTGDSTVRALQAQLRQVLTGVVPGLENANVRSLADVGISTDPNTGALEFDREEFETQLKNNPDDVTALFAEQGRATDSQVEFVRSGTNTQAGKYDINVTQAATQGRLVGDSGVAGTVTIDDSNDEFTLEINRDISVNLKLTQGASVSREALVADIQAQLDSGINAGLSDSGEAVQVGLDSDNKLTFTSGKYGSESSVSVTSVENGTGTALGLSVASGTDGQDIAGTIGGQVAKGDGQVLYLGSDDGPASGLQVRVLGDQTGARGSINFVRGVGKSTVDLVNSFVGADGKLESRTSSLNRELEKIQESQIQLDIRIESYRERLVKQFSAADSLISQLNNTRDYVTQQLEALAPQNNRK